MPPSDKTIARVMLQLLSRRVAASSICPSEVARALAKDEPSWRALMPRVRAVAASLQDAGTLRVTRGKTDVERADMDAGPIRLRRGAGFRLDAPAMTPATKGS